MKAEIITIGDEILIGQIVDTNSAYIASALDNIGIKTIQISSIQDNREAILEVLTQAENRSDIIILTGGLGPTNDDITKNTLCDYFQDNFVFREDIYNHIVSLFEKHLNQKPNELNKQQALVPSKAVVLHNKYGTAPGMWFENNSKTIISLPGVPFEMKNLMKNEVLPRLIKTFNRPIIIHKTILTLGVGESSIAEMIKTWEKKLPTDIKLAYLPSPGSVRLRLSTTGTDQARLHAAIDRQVKGLNNLIGNIIVGYEGELSIEETVANLLKKKEKTLSTAESCTGGQIAKMITSMSGASAYFKGGLVTYATESKVSVLQVKQEIIDQFSVVSAPVAESMAVHARKMYQTDYSIATTGNAGPNKGDSDAEVGIVFIAIASENGVISQQFHFGKERVNVIKRASNMALDLLRKEILKN